LGGVMGLALLVARVKMAESNLFTHHAGSSKSRGNIFLLLKPKLLFKYLSCIAIGIPIYFTTGILFTFAPELTRGLNVQGEVTAGNAILLGSIGLAVGDLLSGIISQALRSRKKSIGMSLYTLATNPTSTWIYAICLVIGIAVGYWAMLVTVAAEQFGTNIRATVATTIPNFVRGSAVMVTLLFVQLKESFAVPHAAFLVGTFCFSLAFLGLWYISETFSKDLNYTEEG
jgi:MFS transporter, putative metabolite:H+ symporter